MESSTVTVESGIARVTMNRPEARNALNPSLAVELTESFSRLGSDDSVRVIILSGTGPVFCAGADLNRMSDAVNLTPEENEREVRQLANLFRTIYECPKPTIARVHGAVYGGGIGLVAACDLSAAAITARFCFSEVRLGLVPAIISPFVVRRMPGHVLRRYFLTAEVFTTVEACRFGLITSFAGGEEAIDLLIGHWIKLLCLGAPGAIAEAKRLTDLATKPITNDLIREMSQMLAARRVSDEGVEGVAAFLEKRSPGWCG